MTNETILRMRTSAAEKLLSADRVEQARGQLIKQWADELELELGNAESACARLAATILECIDMGTKLIDVYKQPTQYQIMQTYVEVDRLLRFTMSEAPDDRAAGEMWRAYEKLAEAVRVECDKFRFPDEDRPGIWEALQAVEAARKAVSK